MSAAPHNLPVSEIARMLAEAKEVAERTWGADGLPRPEFIDPVPVEDYLTERDR